MIEEPMLCRLNPDKKPSNKSNYLNEVKLDGMRMKSTQKGNLVSRVGTNRTKTFPEVSKELTLFLPDAELDGEIITGRGTYTDYVVLKKRLISDDFKISLFTNPKLKTYLPVTFAVFDIKKWEGKDIRNYPLLERKRILHRYAQNTEHIKLVQTWDNAEFLFEMAIKLGHEGIVSKRIDSPYVSGDNEYWFKTKHRETKDAVVVGITVKHALVLSINGVYIGKAGTYRGYPANYRHTIAENLKQFKTNEPFIDLPNHVKREIEFYTLPKQWVEVECSTEFENGVIREPVFVRLRNDKKEVVKSS